ncbi:HlyD family type I secretion periplasmic adaptor subunit [Immundisolibacter sp.]|uniref:HlyD family type I secretion periplasmic adaptor subunit n=1 Tax=Immundisolibacter sp. TaxID=1934948 RepID=UPI0025C648F5|nr:HlyD family type I secretion periplasmic adaptor subunit [Immundisolibacter sp.]MEA3221248.1 Type I secretion system membrane fusion protein PrsE [Immundisolibacter sp.]
MNFLRRRWAELRLLWRDVDRDDLDYMADTTAVDLDPAHPAGHMILLAVTMLLVVALVWAALAKVDEVTHADGQVIPSSQVQIVQNLEGGIVQEILVREGDIVDKDQILLRIDDTRFASSYQEGRVKYLSLLAQVARLTAETEGKPLEVPPEVEKEAPALAEDARRLYRTRQQELASSVQILEQQRDQRQQELFEMQSRLGQLERSYALLNEELTRTAPLAAEGVISEVELLRLKRQVNEVRGDLDGIRLRLPAARAALSESVGKIEDVRIKFRTEAQGQLNDAKAELSATVQNNTAALDRVTRTSVRSPVRGTIKRLKVTTVGGVVQPGMDLVEVVPLEDSLLVEAKVKPQDIAFLHPGQRAMVKLTAYDSTIYGALEATLEHISADSITQEDDKGGERSFFLIRVRTLDRGYVKDGESLPIIPGMTATVDVLTGRKSVLHYLLRPINRARERALRER